MMNVTYLLIMLYSPVSPYFSGTAWDRFDDLNQCMSVAGQKIGSPLETTMAWEVEMMGPRPHVVAAYCVPGATSFGEASPGSVR